MEEKSDINKGLRSKAGFFSIFIDLIMVIVVIINLLFVTFDWSFNFSFFQEFVQSVSPEFFVYYRDVVHPDFLLYDTFFVTLFVGELLIQWFISIVTKRYARWWVYPFVQWYDVLGCIPLGAFIWLRLFRIIAIMIRLHKMGVINLRKTYLYKEFYTKYQLFVHDVADRAMIKLLEAAQRGVKKERADEDGSVLANAIKPDQHELAKVFSAKIHEVVDNNYHMHRDDMKEQIKLVIQNGFANSEQMTKLEHIPFIGSRISEKLETLLNDITFQLADSLSSKLASGEVTQIIEQVVNTSLEAMMKDNKELKTETSAERELNTIVTDILYRALQQVKEDIDTNRKNNAAISEPDEDVTPSE